MCSRCNWQYNDVNAGVDAEACSQLRGDPRMQAHCWHFCPQIQQQGPSVRGQKIAASSDDRARLTARAAGPQPERIMPRVSLTDREQRARQPRPQPGHRGSQRRRLEPLCQRRGGGRPVQIQQIRVEPRAGLGRRGRQRAMSRQPRPELIDELRPGGLGIGGPQGQPHMPAPRRTMVRRYQPSTTIAATTEPQQTRQRGHHDEPCQRCQPCERGEGRARRGRQGPRTIPHASRD